MMNKTCGECIHFEIDVVAATCKKKFWISDDNTPACTLFEPRVVTNGERVRHGGNRELAEISIYEDRTPDGVIIYRSTFIVDKFFLTKNCAVAVAEAWLNASVEAESEVTNETN